MRKVLAMCIVISAALWLSGCNDESFSQQDYDELGEAYIDINARLSNAEKAVYACEEIIGLAAGVQDNLSDAWCILSGQDATLDPDEAASDLEMAYSICQQIIDAANNVLF